MHLEMDMEIFNTNWKIEKCVNTTKSANVEPNRSNNVQFKYFIKY